MNENKKILNEEDVNLPGGETLPTSALSADWNTLYKKYIRSNFRPPVVIKVERLGRRNKDFSSPSGYLKYTGDGLGKDLGLRNLDRINAEDLDVVQNKEDATLFAEEDVDKFVKAIKRDKNIYTALTTKFTAEPSSIEQRRNTNYSLQILRQYFEVLCGNPEASDWLRSCEYMVNDVCSRIREKPLQGNPIFRVLKTFYEVNPSMRLSPSSFSKIYNLIKDRVVNPNSLIEPRTFRDVIFFNESLYKFDKKEIEELLQIYDDIRLKTSWSNIKNLQGLKISTGDQLAKNCLIVRDEDLFGNLLAGTISGRSKAIDEFNELPEIGDEISSNDYKIVKGWLIREPDVAAELLTLLGGSERLNRNKEQYYIQILRDGFLLKDRTKPISGYIEDEAQASGKIFGVKLDVSDIIRLVKANEDTKDKSTLKNLLEKPNDSIRTKAFLKVFDIDNGIVISKEKGLFDIDLQFEIQTKSDSNKYILKRFEPSIASRKVPQEGPEEPLEPENTPEVQEEPQDNLKKFNGKTLEEIIKMDTPTFRAFSPGLSDEDRTALKSLMASRLKLLK